MHYDVLQQIARQRTAEVRRAAESGCIRDRAGQRVPVRHRTGRALAAIGLRGTGASDAM